MLYYFYHYALYVNPLKIVMLRCDALLFEIKIEPSLIVLLYVML